MVPGDPPRARGLGLASGSSRSRQSEERPDAESAGHGALNLTIDSVDEADRTLRDRGIVPGELVEASEFVRILPVTDPDGNSITLLQAR
ncbi:hypothetical protein EV188_103203 [Actinomycetospora succinea]|uniref:VOC domain-containing protein n=1 Tax=Actinomycetospora succinea TaxID=663603 RepID=A0A4R6VD84_9PSEU|nr:hypothetical protein EV188_103203 [Actinomycetospora succinea]